MQGGDVGSSGPTANLGHLAAIVDEWIATARDPGEGCGQGLGERLKSPIRRPVAVQRDVVLVLAPYEDDVGAGELSPMGKGERCQAGGSLVDRRVDEVEVRPLPKVAQPDDQRPALKRAVGAVFGTHVGDLRQSLGAEGHRLVRGGDVDRGMDDTPGLDRLQGLQRGTGHRVDEGGGGGQHLSVLLQAPLERELQNHHHDDEHGDDPQHRGDHSPGAPGFVATVVTPSRTAPGLLPIPASPPFGCGLPHLPPGGHRLLGHALLIGIGNLTWIVDELA